MIKIVINSLIIFVSLICVFGIVISIIALADKHPIAGTIVSIGLISLFAGTMISLEDKS